MRVDRVLCSDLPRARMTAAPSLAATGLTADYLPLLRERDFGDILGTPYSELDGDLYDESYEPINGETATQFRTGVHRAWHRIRRSHRTSSESILVITHGHFCRVSAEEVLTIDGEPSRPSAFANASLTIAASSPPHPVELHNCTVHLG